MRPKRCPNRVALAWTLPAIAASALLQGCVPRLQLEAPKEPIVINLNVKIEQEVRVRVDRDLEQLFEQDKELFGTKKEKS